MHAWDGMLSEFKRHALEWTKDERKGRVHALEHTRLLEIRTVIN